MLEVAAIVAAYGEVRALWDVSLRVDEGEVVTLLGANGAGKTTTMRVLSGLLRPLSGSVTFAGRGIHRLAPPRIVQAGLVQIPEGRRLWPRMTVLENLELGAYAPHLRARRRETQDWVFSLFPRLAERRRQLAGTLSGGEQQMLAIGRGLMSRPRLLMLDEPSLGLAPILVREVFTIIGQINARGVTVLLVEQNVRQALEIAHRGYVLETGRVVRSGSARDLLEDPEIKRAYLGL
ncbi:MAG: ABC transporter ATP-binding protein [Bacillati bacterium ANGP1]|uniref:ABC transporter ATP-binding protein n=1 Tax=Candidatus Segetimicrobium genomatis TaxID=2569760 RepID=A0A537M861_9BACT|nr:MAG: ABC transporter ATP-binding protein [Terrabacteria group bacterium ANGP1]